MRKHIVIFLAALLLAGCDIDSLINLPVNKPQTEQDKDADSNEDAGSNEDKLPDDGTTDTPGVVQHEGLMYVWDESVIPEITMTVSLDQWNKLLSLYDQNADTKEYVKCNITYKKGTETTEIIDAGIRLRGNTSRRRPEGNGGENHKVNSADWHHCHFGVNLRKFNKDNDQIKTKDIKGIRKFNLKWFKECGQQHMTYIADFGSMWKAIASRHTMVSMR